MEKIICIGDSNTFGFDPRNFSGGQYAVSWPGLLAEELACETANLGECGRMVPDELEAEWLDREIRRNLPADTLMVMLGTNDLLMAIRPSEQIVTGRMREYLRHLQEEFPQQRLILAAPPPVTITERGYDKAVQRLARCYESLSKELNVDFVDSQTFGLSFAFDGVHLTEEAHRVFAKKMAQALRQLDE